MNTEKLLPQIYSILLRILKKSSIIDNSMTDYSFMQSGRGIPNQPELNIEDEKYIASLLTLFTSNAIINASEYSTICGRNGITKEDVKYALIFEVFEFLKNPNIISDLQEIEKDIETEMENEDDENWEDVEDSSNIVDDTDIESFSRITQTKFNILEESDKEFVTKIHKYYDGWDNWVPTNKLEEILKNAIDKT